MPDLALPDLALPDLALPDLALPDLALPDLALPLSRLTLIAGQLGVAGSVDGNGALAQFSKPTAVTADGAGNLFVADNGNHTIRKVVAATGVVTTLAGTAGMAGSADGTGAAARFNGPNSVAVDGADNLFVSDRQNNTIRKVVVATGVVTTLAGTAGMAGSNDGTGAAARFNDPHGVAVDGAGNLFVADYLNHTIRKVVVATGAVTTLAGTAGMTGSTDGTGAAARFNGVGGLAVDSSGNLYASDAFNNTIRKVVVATGVVTTLAGTAGMTGSADGTGAAARFNAPQLPALDGAGYLYVPDFQNATVRKIVLASGVVTTYVGVAGQAGAKLGPLPGGLNQPTGVTVLQSGGIAIIDLKANAVLRAN
jgi:hypothetical protein